MRPIIFFVLLLTSTNAWAQFAPPENRIEVVGHGEIKVVPNQFVLFGAVETFDKNLEKATTQNLKRVEKIFQTMRKLGVARKYIVTSEISLNLVSQGYRERGNYRVLGYKVSRNVRVVLHKAERIQAALKKLFRVGIDRLRLSMFHTDVAGFQQNAQIKAAHDARSKAKRLASSLGLRLGPAKLIKEENGHSNQPQTFTYTADTPDLGEGLSLDKIRVASAVKVTFELL